MAVIYYMYIKGTTIGYIGQYGGPESDVKRIMDHIRSSFDTKPDSAGRMIQQYGIDKVRYLIFNKDTNFGIPQNIYDEFQKMWTYSGTGDDAKLDLAEILHVIRAKLLGTSAAKFNMLIGGFQASGLNATLTYTINSDITGDSSIDTILKGFRMGLEEKRFSVNLTKFDDAWRKIVHPIGYLALSGPFKSALMKYMREELIGDLFSTDTMKELIKEYLIKSLKDPNNKSHKPSDFNNKIKQEIKNQFNKKTGVVRKKIQAILHEKLGGHYCKDFQFSWNMKDKTVDEMMKNIFNRIDNISNLMWQRIATLSDSGEIIVNHQLVTTKGARSGGEQISTAVYDFADSVFTSIKWEPNQEPEWAKKLREVSIDYSKGVKIS